LLWLEIDYEGKKSWPILGWYPSVPWTYSRQTTKILPKKLEPRPGFKQGTILSEWCLPYYSYIKYNRTSCL